MYVVVDGEDATAILIIAIDHKLILVVGPIATAPEVLVVVQFHIEHMHYYHQKQIDGEGTREDGRVECVANDAVQEKVSHRNVQQCEVDRLYGHQNDATNVDGNVGQFDRLREECMIVAGGTE